MRQQRHAAPGGDARGHGQRAVHVEHDVDRAPGLPEGAQDARADQRQLVVRKPDEPGAGEILQRDRAVGLAPEILRQHGDERIAPDDTCTASPGSHAMSIRRQPLWRNAGSSFFCFRHGCAGWMPTTRQGRAPAVNPAMLTVFRGGCRGVSAGSGMDARKAINNGAVPSPAARRVSTVRRRAYPATSCARAAPPGRCNERCVAGCP